MLVEGEHVALIRSSACGGGSDKSGSGFVRPEGAGTSEEIGPIDVTLSSIPGNSWVGAGRRAAADSETEGVT